MASSQQASSWQLTKVIWMPAIAPHSFRDEFPLVFWLATKGELFQIRRALKRESEAPQSEGDTICHRQRCCAVSFGVREQHRQLRQDAPRCLQVPGAQKTQPIGLDCIEAAVFPIACNAREQKGPKPSEPHHRQQRHRELPRRARVAQRCFSQQARCHKREMRQTAAQIVELFAAARQTVKCEHGNWHTSRQELRVQESQA